MKQAGEEERGIFVTRASPRMRAILRFTSIGVGAVRYRAKWLVALRYRFYSPVMCHRSSPIDVFASVKTDAAAYPELHSRLCASGASVDPESDTGCKLDAGLARCASHKRLNVSALTAESSEFPDASLEE